MEYSIRSLIIILALVIAFVVILAFITSIGSESNTMVKGIKEFLFGLGGGDSSKGILNIVNGAQK